jgi:hypothetical protein
MNLDELERLLKAATAGPWEANGPELIQKAGDICLIVCDAEAELCQQDAALIAALRNCAEELIRDARRYRWLRDAATSDHWEAIGYLHGEWAWRWRGDGAPFDAYVTHWRDVEPPKP